MKNVYIAGRLQEEIEVTSLFGKSQMALSGLADGCIGVMLVFSNKKKAKKFAGGYALIEGRAGKPHATTHAETADGVE